MSDPPATCSEIRADHSIAAVRLRNIAAQAESFTRILDEMRDHIPITTTPEDRAVITAIVEQAAAAAHDLAITAGIAADAITT